MAFIKHGSTPSSSSSFSINTSKKLFIIFSFLFLFIFPLLLFTIVFPSLYDIVYLQADPNAPFPPPNKVELPKWLRAIRGTHIARQKTLRLGLVNINDVELFSQLRVHGIIDPVTIDLEPVSPNVTWEKLFPEWIDETMPVGSQCPKIPVPEPRKYSGLDVVMALIPCGEKDEYKNGTLKNGKEGTRSIARLQMSLAIAHLIVQNYDGRKDEDIYAVFTGKCEPMVEIFRCDDLVWHGGEYWVYKPKLEKLREMISMPVGSCDLASPYAYNSGTRQSQTNPNKFHDLEATRREAYVTMLHSSEEYVCGAIALAQSILQTNTTKDLILLADHSISSLSIKGLQAAGWKIKRIDRIRSPNAKSNAYNVWNYSKLRVWQLTQYDKVMFIDSDFIVLRNIDHFFDLPQLSAAPNNKWLFNSGIMILEPSECFFKSLMSKRYEIRSYNGGDQGYLNEVLTWWHRLTLELNFMKFFGEKKIDEDRLVPEDRYTVHFLGLKPWTCYRDYDCNWDREDYQVFASDQVHARWWQVYDTMASKLQPYCAMTNLTDSRIRYRRDRAQKANFSDGHWRIKFKDPRQYNLVKSPRKNKRLRAI